MALLTYSISYFYLLSLNAHLMSNFDQSKRLKSIQKVACSPSLPAGVEENSLECSIEACWCSLMTSALFLSNQSLELGLPVLLGLPHPSMSPDDSLDRSLSFLNLSRSILTSREVLEAVPLTRLLQKDKN